MNFKFCISLFSLYGYSNLFLVLGTLLPLFPNRYIEVLVFLVFVFISTIFLFVNLRRFLDEFSDKGKKIVSFFVSGVQVLASLLYIFIFYL